MHDPSVYVIGMCLWITGLVLLAASRPNITYGIVLVCHLSKRIRVHWVRGVGRVVSSSCCCRCRASAVAVVVYVHYRFMSHGLWKRHLPPPSLFECALRRRYVLKQWWKIFLELSQGLPPSKKEQENILLYSKLQTCNARQKTASYDICSSILDNRWSERVSLK